MRDPAVTTIAAIVSAIIIIVFVINRAFAKKGLPYRRRNLLTKSEYAFWRVLQSLADKNGFLICPKVRMEDFLAVSAKSEKGRQSWRGKVKSRHIDFIICDRNLNMLAGIELDDNSHKYNEDTIKSDRFKNAVFAAIKIPLYRIQANNSRYEEQISGIMKSLKNKYENSENEEVNIEERKALWKKIEKQEQETEQQR